MRHTLTIARRELTSLFYSPIAYLVLGLFAFGTAIIFYWNFGPGQPATLRGAFEALFWLMILLVPAISMRTISEEFRSGTIETLMTAPISDAQVVVGKWLGTLAFFATLLAPLLLLILLLEWHARPDYGPIFTGLLGLVLVAGLYLAVGAFASALTQNQIIALVVTVFLILVLTLAAGVLASQQIVPPSWRRVFFYVNINSQFEDFKKGLIDLTNLIYFASGIAFFLFVTTKVLESRRWR